MLYECYLDDSKDQRQEFAYVCAGFYGAPKAWKRFNKNWNKQLGREGIKYFKTSEFTRLTGQFAKFSKLPKPHGKDAAGQVRDRLKQTIRDSSGLRGVGVAVPMEDYRAVMSHDSADRVFGSNGMYHRAFETTLYRAVQLACKRPDDGVAFFHDDGPDFDALRSLYTSFKKKNPKSGSRMKGFLPLNDKDHGELQAADIFANSVMGITVAHLLHKETAHNSNILLFDRSDLSVWSKQLGETLLLRNMASLKISAPESLIRAVAEYGITPIG